MEKIEAYLRKMGVEEKKISFYVEKVIKFLAILTVIVILLVFSQLAIFYGIFAWIGAQVRVLTGLDEFITKGIAFLVMALFFGTPLGGFIWSFAPIPQKKKNMRKKRTIFLIVLAVLCFASFFASRNVYFNVNTGEAEKYYSIGVDGRYVFYSSPGFDPVTGEELRPVTKEIIKSHLVGIETIGERIGNGEFYHPVTFSNESYRNLNLHISDGYDLDSGVSVRKLNSGTSSTFYVSEGVHYFILTDASNNFQGHRKGGKILTLEKSSFVFSDENNNFIYFDRSFKLDVINLDKQEIRIENEEVFHSNDMNSKEEDRIVNLKILGFLLLGLFVVFIIQKL